MKIGILQTGHAPSALVPTLGSFADLSEQLLQGKGFSFETWNVVDMDFPDDVHQADGWLITGSKHGVYEDHAFLPPLEEFIHQAFDAGVPQVGVCFGHQVIAKALGGQVEKFRGGWAVGRQDYEMGDSTVSLNAWHQDQVTKAPNGAKVVAHNAFCENAALVYDTRAFTVQAHPEFESSFIQGLIETRGHLVPQDLLDIATQQLPKGNDNAKLAAQIAQFFLNRKLDTTA